MCVFILIASNCWGQTKLNFVIIAFSENGLLLCHIYGYVLIICLPYEVHQFYVLLVYFKYILVDSFSTAHVAIRNFSFLVLCIRKLNVCISNFSNLAMNNTELDFDRTLCHSVRLASIIICHGLIFNIICYNTTCTYMYSTLQGWHL